MTDWKKVREEYERNEGTVQSICTFHSISRTQLYRRRRAENWERRKSRHSVGMPENEDAVNSSPDRKALIDRLYAAFDRQMGEFESHLDGSPDEGVNEKDARTLGSLARTLEKLIDLKQEEEGEQEDTGKGVDIERLRQELANRIERLRQRREPE